VKPIVRSVIGIAGIAAAVGAGFWWGRSQPMSMPTATVEGAAGAEAGKTGGRKLLYYRNPMGLPDTSPVPKKDSMGMDYIPVYEGEEADDGGSVKLSVAKVQKLGVRVERAEKRVLKRQVRASGRVEIDERRVVSVAPRFEGWVDKLHVNVTGQPVAKGQPLFEVYSPDLVSAQREYQVASKGVVSLREARPEAKAGMRQLADAALARLKTWEISDEQIQALEASLEPQRTMTFRAPASGVVTEKKAVQGMRFMPGEALFQIADLSAVWVVADVFEQDIGIVKNGAAVTVGVSAYPGESFVGRITYVYPTLKAETRTIPVRVELANPGGKLKPAMFAEVTMDAAISRAGVTVPHSAVIDSGQRQVVFVQKDEGRFEPREVRVGARDADYVELLSGVQAGEVVVVGANFLIDAESNLKAAVTGMSEAKPATGKVGHQAEGVLDAVDAKTGALTISHEPVASLNWPRMTMEFVPSNAAVAGALKPGAKVRFEFVERGPGEWVVTKMEAR
jgi:Cu(I)/Ag(I) efflux system membrane fusion protein